MNCPNCGSSMLYSGEKDEAEIWYCDECDQDIPVIDVPDAPNCPHCGSSETYLFDVFFGDPVWECLNDSCPNTENEHFFDEADLAEARR